MNYFVCKETNGNIILAKETQLLDLYKSKMLIGNKDTKRIPNTIIKSRNILDKSIDNKNIIKDLFEELDNNDNVSGWLPGALYPDDIHNEIKENTVKMNNDILEVLYNIRKVFGTTTVASTGNAWRVDKAINQKTIKTQLLADAIYYYYFMTDYKLDFIIKVRNWEDNTMQKIAKSIVDANKIGLCESLAESISCVEYLAPETINQLEINKDIRKFIFI